jgi:hypothetical protein
MFPTHEPSGRVGWHSFPPYLGYALADETSVRKIDGEFVMDYQIGGQKMIEVTLSENSAQIADFEEGKRIRLSSADNLQRCVVRHFQHVEQKFNPLHLAWVKTVCASGNILTRYIRLELDESIEYPNVCTIDIFIPFPLSNRSAIAEILSFPELEKVWVRVFEGMLAWTRRQDRSHVRENINVVCITTPPAFVPHIVQSISHLIIPGRMWRAFTGMHEKDKDNHIELVFGSEKEEFINYTLLFKSHKTKETE